MKSSLIKLITLDDSIAWSSSPVPVDQIYTLAAQYVFSANTSAGTIKLQGSCDAYKQPLPISSQLPVTWADVPSVTASVTAGAPGILSLNVVPYNWVRIVWTPSAGTGILTVNMVVKG